MDQTMKRPLQVGDVIHGFAHGAFGRDHYTCCTIEAVGPDWIVARNDGGGDGNVCALSGSADLEFLINERDNPGFSYCDHDAPPAARLTDG